MKRWPTRCVASVTPAPFGALHRMQWRMREVRYSRADASEVKAYNLQCGDAGDGACNDDPPFAPSQET